MLCPKCGRFMGTICFPPTPTCDCVKPFDFDFDEDNHPDDCDCRVCEAMRRWDAEVHNR